MTFSGGRHHRARRLCTIAMMLPSESLNHAALAPPAVVIPFASVSGKSYFSNVTAAALQLRDFRLDVRNVPEGLARLRRASVGCRIEEARGAAGKLVDDAATDLLFRLEADLSLRRRRAPGRRRRLEYISRLDNPAACLPPCLESEGRFPLTKVLRLTMILDIVNPPPVTVSTKSTSALSRDRDDGRAREQPAQRHRAGVGHAAGRAGNSVMRRAGCAAANRSADYADERRFPGRQNPGDPRRSRGSR